MSNRDKRSRKFSNSTWKNEMRSRHSDFEEEFAKRSFRHTKFISNDQIRKEEEAIRSYKVSNRPLCSHCGQPIVDMTQALADKKSNGPVHFDCVLEIISEREKLSHSDQVAYIGQGRFGIIHFANERDMKHFTIEKIIEWEDKDAKASWRSEIAELYSKVK